MSTEAEALNALKTILAGIDPDPEPAPANIWVYPAEYKRIKFNTFPVIVVSRVINRPAKFTRFTTGGTIHRWTAEILLFLSNGPLLDDEQMALAEAVMVTWPRAMKTVLFANQWLNNTVQSIGDADFLTYQAGHIHFWKKVFFGVRFEVMVNQI